MIFDDLGDDGLPIRKGAKKDCTMCRGYGICEHEDSHYAPSFVPCPRCFPETAKENGLEHRVKGSP